MSNDIYYSFVFPLKNYDKLEKTEERGIALDEEKKFYKVHMAIKGTTDNYEIIFDKNKILRDASQKIKEDVKTLVKPDDDKMQYAAPDEHDTLETISGDDFY
jgi:succinate dehydrogenase/fumarate reductase flavoprotein subunit